VLVASGDRDAFQLASVATTVLHPVKAGEMARIGPAEVRDRYGVEPEQVPDFIALRGDPSDRLPGARGVGAKGAATLLQRYGTLDRIIAEGRLTEQADALKLYKRLATMDATAPLPALGDQTPNWAQAAALARQWELNQLAERFDERSVSFADSSPTAKSISVNASPRKMPARSQAASAGPQQILKIATFNVNNVNRRLTNLLAWIGKSKPDVVCLQELKCTDDAFPAAALHGADYDAVWRGQRTYNGIAVVAKANEPVLTRIASRAIRRTTKVAMSKPQCGDS
jgi:hypothetical protein